MKRVVFFIFTLFLLTVPHSYAQNAPIQDPKQQYYKAIVEEIVESGHKTIENQTYYYQTLRVKILNGTLKGKFVIIQNGKDVQITKDQLVSANEQVIVSKITYPNGQSSYIIYDFYRLNTLLITLTIFFVVIVLIAGSKGFGSIFGLIAGLSIISFYILPNILKGQDPLTITLIGSTVILVVSTYLAHGISKKTTIAVVSTFIALLLAAFFSIIAIQFNKITGFGNEDLFTLQIGSTSVINIKGLFLSAIIIGTLGALNDITTTQATAVYELKEANHKLKLEALFTKGMNIGKEHIASLINTLILAYVGSSFAVFIFLSLNPNHLPYWVIFNNEIISDEVIKIVAGSIGLLLSVPVVTFIASMVFEKEKFSEK